MLRWTQRKGGAPPPAYAQTFFTGVPAPAGAGLVLFPLFLGLEARSLGWTRIEVASHNPFICAAILIGTATLLVSTLPVWSFKNFKVPSHYVLPVLLGVGLFAAVLLADPWGALAALSLIYAAMLPLSRRSFHRLRAEAEGHDDAAAIPPGVTE